MRTPHSWPVVAPAKRHAPGQWESEAASPLGSCHECARLALRLGTGPPFHQRGGREAAKKKGRAKAELTPAHTPHASNRPLLSESAIPLPRQHAERRKVRGELIGCFVSVSIGGGPDVSSRQGASFKPNGLASRLRGSAQRPRKKGVGPAGRRRDSRPRGRSAFARLVSMAASRTPEEMQGADWLSVCVPIG